MNEIHDEWIWSHCDEYINKYYNFEHTVKVDLISNRLDNYSYILNAMLDLAESAGVDGVVCSPHELDLVKSRNSLLTITPGIRLEDLFDDQKRVMTPKEAKDKGADYLVIGRPITSSVDIKKTLNEIYVSIQ